MADYDDDDTFDIHSGEEDILYSDDGADSHYEFAEENIEKNSTSSGSKRSYVVLKEEDIHKHQKNDIERISTILSITQVESIVLLLHYRWCVSKLEDEDRVRKLAGILKEPIVGIDDRSSQCGICFESYILKDVSLVSCGHPYCNTCWRSYITTKINDGSGCLMIKCPEPSCSAMVGQDMVDKIVEEKDKEKYYRYFLRSYVEESAKKIKWCPSPGCEYAVDIGNDEGENYDVSCLCSFGFCWNCSEDAHRPLDCDTVSKWMLKNKDESENTNWILANTKPCPNPSCKRPIEKNQGCNHMYCLVCKCSFCWNCLCLLTNHKTCNKFKEDKRVMAKKAIDRYLHYFGRWSNNQSSRLKAMKDLKKVQSKLLKELSYKQKTTEVDLRFIVDAWLQIIECRRVLKWTYAYGYYLPEDEEAKKDFFEYLHGEAETCLERLHHCAEKEMYEFVIMSDDDQDPSQNFSDFKSKLLGLTKATKTYFENLVKALEDGLVEVAHTKTKTKTRTTTTTKSNSSKKRQKLAR